MLLLLLAMAKTFWHLFDKQKPNIVLLDLGLRNQNSLQVVKLVKNKFSGTLK